jgi:hypothetical protein
MTTYPSAVGRLEVISKNGQKLGFPHRHLGVGVGVGGERR